MAEAGQEEGAAPPRRAAVIEELAALYDLTAKLRRECPWDRAQAQPDIVAYTLEETYELIDAVRSLGAAPPVDDPRHSDVRGELGDLLFQVYFLAQVAEEAGWYDLGQVAAGIREKLVRRHPHIFADAHADTPAEVRRTWDDIKRHTEGREGIFHEVPQALSAALYAQKLQQRAATVGFDWREAAEVFAKIREEADELEQALTASSDRDRRPLADDHRGASPADPRVAAEVGDLLFSVVNLARKLAVDPELELRASARRFMQRVQQAAEMAGADGARFEGMDLETQETYYQKAKAVTNTGSPAEEPSSRDEVDGGREGATRGDRGPRAEGA
ncbi:MAG: nucleoside triphosphate pyrophosphohydrolase [Actinobacteria bacterium]|nr:nucleoside triphosphate pyrophosphohydrolase [Actinomycetota bacterium]